ncbi:type I secretion target GGXGXDXXX repeat-containing domain protein, partial [Aggregatibacter sp. oral taxon 458 str. W10330]
MEEKEMALPTVERITNEYLYKNDQVIDNRLDENLISQKGTTISVDKKEFMKGPGRFVNASDFSIVSAFFTQKNDIVAMNREEAILSNLAEGEYSKQEILKILGYIDSNGKGINGMFAGANKTLGFYDDGKDDLLERAYVWNSTSYKISDTARFIINKNGERRIEGFGIEPGRVDKSGEMIDDFDFIGGGWSNLVNPGLETVIDPSGIGKTVTITFTGKIDTYTLTSTAFEKEKDKKSYWSLFNGASNYIHLNRLINKLWDSGSIKHLYQGKPIIYGSADENGKGKNDVISGTKIIRKILGKEVTIDISNPKVEKGSLNLLGLSINGSSIIGGTSSASNFAKLDNPLSEYVKNGIAYVTGDGDDRITGTNNNDLFLGGDGNDILIGKGGDDELYGGRGNDVLYGDYTTDSASSSSNESSSGSGNNDILNGGAGNDILNGGKGYDTYYIGDNDVIIDSDGVGKIHFLRKDYQMKTAEDLKKENERGIHIPRFNPQGLPPGQVFTLLYDLHFDFGNGNPNGGTNKLFGFLEKVDDGNGSALFTLKDSAEKVIYYFDVEQPRMVDVKRIGKTAFKPYVSKSYWNGGLQSHVMTAKRLTITEADTGHKVVINNFINGMLNIGLTDVEVYDGMYSRIYLNQARQNSGGGWGGNHQADVRGQGADMDSGSGNSSGSDNSTGTGNHNHGGNPDRSSPNPNRPSPNQGGRHYEVYDPLALDLDGD